MEKVGYRRKWGLLVGWLGMVVQFLLTDCSHHHGHGKITGRRELVLPHVLHLQIQNHQVVMDNGIVNVTLSSPEGMVTGIQYKGVNNILELNQADNRGYWDVVWNNPGFPTRIDKLAGTSFKVIVQNENQIEISFTKTMNVGVPLNVDKRFIMLRGSSGFYSYAIFERLKGGPDLNVDQARIVFKLQPNMFHYMAVSDQRQRIMPMPVDRETGQTLNYPEAVHLTKPTNPDLKGEVDDKYQYSCDNKDNKVHGWICNEPAIGFWMITPSNEFRTGGPLKQDLTSHVGSTVLSMFVSTHYAGEDTGMKFRNGEPWRKVFGPVFIYLNSISSNQKPQALWKDAKAKMGKETASWPYNFPLSADFSHSNQRGIVRGQLLVRDRYINKVATPAASANVGLAPPGAVGSWQRENKGYQFWTQADAQGNFLIKGVRVGTYSLYAWVPGTIGDYKFNGSVTITPGSNIKLGGLVYEPPRNGPTLWEIGIPDRTAAEFYVPDPNPSLANHHIENFRQYGLWFRYTDLYPHQDLIYTVGVSNYKKDWFFAHVTRNMGNHAYKATTWQILFELKTVNKAAIYTLQLALASANAAELQVRVNNQQAKTPLFTTGLIGKDNAIARHGIHGLYWLYSVKVSGPLLVNGRNTIFLTQSRASNMFQGLMYDYIRLEGPA
uniref:rhamnogalacturonan endolyase n=1 Tax=Davidia involucrata TaxID=16924 RepID=A0A5B6ZSC2_DAVIN